MIRVIRLPTPRILLRKATAWRSKLLAARTEKERKRAEGKYKHPQVKEALVKMFRGKCAYCESCIAHIDYGHIEHFRPKGGKSGQPKLTFEWSNLFLACGICNGKQFKGDLFPGPADGGSFVNPCEEEPTDHFQFDFDENTGLANCTAPLALDQ